MYPGYRISELLFGYRMPLSDFFLCFARAKCVLSNVAVVSASTLLIDFWANGNELEIGVKLDCM